MFIFEGAIQQIPIYREDGVMHILLSEQFMLKRDCAGYYIKRRGDLKSGLGTRFDPEAYLDTVAYMLRHEVDHGHEERHLAGSVWLKKRPQLRVTIIGDQEHAVNEGIYMLTDKSEFMGDDYHVRPKQLLYAMHCLANTPPELLQRAPHRTQVPMFAGGRTIYSGRKMN